MGIQSPSVEYLSCGANRQTAVADWAQSDLLAFGADSNVALWRPNDEHSKGVYKLLAGHTAQVKAVSFLPQADGDKHLYLLSGSDDKSLVFWKSDSENRFFEKLYVSNDHSGAINCIASLRCRGSNPSWLLATGAADATVKIWGFHNDSVKLLQTIKTTPKFFPLSVSIAYLDDDSEVAILAVAGTRDTVQIMTAETSGDTAQFSLQASLTGHEGWIRSLSFTKESSNHDSDLLLASASQDKYIRIWRIHQGKQLPALAAPGADPTSSAFLPGASPSNKAHKLKAAGKDFSVTFEALLLGHEDWIYSAKWHRHSDGRVQLLSTSADNSLAIWEADPDSGIWVSVVRLGEISREKGATTATGSTGGFWTGLWSPDGKSMACLGRTGSWRRWEHNASEDRWRPCVAISGHTKATTGIAWSKGGEYLLSCSADQTTRLHAQWKTGQTEPQWHEMSRPQIHGYDLNCIDSLGASQFVSGADEKLMRVFNEPKAVASMLSRLSGFGGEDVENMPDAANMPVLGLSNKAIDAVDDDEEIQPVDDRDREAMDPASIVKKSHLDLDHAPFEDTLSRHTLWPETEKLYGHGYEISCLAASHDGKIVASACKASSANHGVIRLFETSRWTEIRPPLTAHSLTATRLRFSSDDKYLLSAGRDRQWAVFERDAENALKYDLLQANPKGHSRMILDATWVSLESSVAFATAGRDKQIKVWSAQPEEEGKLEFKQTASLACLGPVTAIDCLQQTVKGISILAVGFETGKVILCAVSRDGSSITEIFSNADFDLPRTVLQVAWRPSNADERATDAHELAVAGDDSSLRLYSFGESFLEGICS